jgi:type VI protein secretion system component VasF
VLMGRDKRIYRFVQDTRFGRIVLAESHEVSAIVEAVTSYIARRMVERERALAAAPGPAPKMDTRRRSRLWPFALGFVLGAAALFGFALYTAMRTL